MDARLISTADAPTECLLLQLVRRGFELLSAVGKAIVNVSWSAAKEALKYRARELRFFLDLENKM